MKKQKMVTMMFLLALLVTGSAIFLPGCSKNSSTSAATSTGKVTVRMTTL